MEGVWRVPHISWDLLSNHWENGLGVQPVLFKASGCCIFKCLLREGLVKQRQKEVGGELFGYLDSS